MQFGKPTHQNYIYISSELTESRLCTETPTAGGRVFEAGDDKLVQLAYKEGSTFPANQHAHNAYNNNTHPNSPSRSCIHSIRQVGENEDEAISTQKQEHNTRRGSTAG